MKNEHLYLIIGAAVLLALVGEVVLAALHIPAPDILQYTISTGVGALAMAANKNAGNDDAGTAPLSPAARSKARPQAPTPSPSEKGTSNGNQTL